MSKTKETPTAIVDLRPQLEKHLAELRSEFETGQKMLTDLSNKRAELEATMLRISGAVQVLEELVAAPKEGEPNER